MRTFIFAAAILAAAAFACAPAFDIAVFTYQRHPDLPRTAFAGGKLGVLLPSYARSYLVVAYRYLTGVGLDAREREQALSYWTDRGTAGWDKIATDWQKRWNIARSRVAGVPQPKAAKLTAGAMAFDPETQSFALNCTEDAFRTALHTLESREAQFGRASRAVREWTTAQTQVFQNCDRPAPVIPPAASADLPEIVRKDRDYQIAAAHFYAGEYPEAKRKFERIAADGQSPWHEIAPYLVARTQIREERSDSKKAKEILANPQLAAIHGMTIRLLNRIYVQKGDYNYFHELSTLLISRGQGNGFREELWDWTAEYDVLSNYDQWQQEPKKAVDIAPFERDELPDWIATFQGLRPDSEQHAYVKWRSTNKTHWLIAALASATAKTPEASRLIDAGEAIPPNSPGYLTAAFHRLRLLVDSGQGVTARPALDSLLSSGTLPKSSVNLFRGLRMRVSPDLGDFLRFAQRAPLLITLDIDEAQAPGFFYYDDRNRKANPTVPRLDSDSASVLNERTPLALLQQTAASDELTAGLRNEALRAAFTRAIVLGSDDAAKALAAKLSNALPAAVPFVADFEKESTPAGQRFAAAFLLLHFPEMQPYIRSNVGRHSPSGKIDEYRDNWWCAIGTPTDNAPTPPPPSVAFLNTGDRRQAETEYGSLAKAGGGSAFLGAVVVGYARLHLEDPRVPEALHLVVRANRLACDATSKWENARDAFTLLHLRYPGSQWTKRTPVWNRD